MKVNIGKNTLGDSDKMSVSLREYGRSTHNLSSAWRSPMGVGTLVPFMKLVGLPGDTFDIELDTRIMTHPTVGPLFGNFKFQADVFTCPIRLYNAMLHNNTLNIVTGYEQGKISNSRHVDQRLQDGQRKSNGIHGSAETAIRHQRIVTGKQIGRAHV